jgi:hypothetical protein
MLLIILNFNPMNRTIKFRGLSLKKEWVYGYYYKYAAGSFIRVPRPDGGYEDYAVTPKTVTLFTGLTDNNGKDVYEGERVNWPHMGGKIYVVYYNQKECAYFAKPISRKDKTESYLDSKKMEVVRKPQTFK